MRIVRERRPWDACDTPAAVALGFFDGLHIGHQAVINAAGQYAKAHGLRLAVFTFAAGPKNSQAGLIAAQGQKHRLLRGLAVDTCYQPPFVQFAQLAPPAFVGEVLVGEYNAKALFCGENFAFGAARSGDVGQLKTLCAQYGLQLCVTPTALYGGEPVSSSRIRAALGAGRMQEVTAMLGRPYAVETRVRHGVGLGRTLGFPTVNQVFPRGVQPPGAGVYITQTLAGGAVWPSATCYAARRAAGDGGPVCETFIPGFNGGLYGRRVRVEFYKKIADVQKFESLDALSGAVRGLVKTAMAYFGGLEGGGGEPAG